MPIDRFESVSEYITMQTANGDLAALPIPLVAEYLDVSSPAVNAMLKDGRLDGVRVGKSTLVLLNSLQARETKRAGEENSIYKYLKKCARIGNRAVFYEPVMAQVGMTPKIPAHRSRIGWILGQISRKTYAEDGVLLSVLVHQKKAGTTRPGTGFFDLAMDLGFKYMDQDAFVKAQTDKVMKAYG